MASTASLLFNIAANSDDAERSIASFRTLMSKDLGDIGGEFEQWSKQVFGNLTTVNGAMLAIGASAAAALVAAVAFATEASTKYNEYADEISHAMRVTGQGAEALSVLHLAAAETRTSFEGLTTGLVRFESNVVKGAEGSTQLVGEFNKLGVSQSDLKAGQQDLMPLLAKVMDGFHGMASGVDRAAIAKALFSRSGPELLGFLVQGASGLAAFTKKAEELGVVLVDKDIQAFRALKLAEEQLKAQHEALDVTVGKSTIGLERWWQTLKAATAAALMHGAAIQGLVAFAQVVTAQYAAISAEIEKQTKIAQNAPPPPLTDDGAGPKLEKVRTEYYGITSVMEALKTKIASFGDENTRIAAEMSKYSDEVTKAKTELDALEKSGKITAESAARESAALALIPQMLTRIWQETWDKQIQMQAAASQKKIAEQLAAENDLRAKLAAATESGVEGQRAALGREIDAMAASYREKGQMTQEMVDLINALYAAGLAKIAAQEQAAADNSDNLDRAAADKANERFLQEMNRLAEHQEQILAVHTTGRQKLELQYDIELRKFSEVEEARVVSTLTNETQIAAIHDQFAATRTAITTKFGQDLQTLLNSEGWQGVFGSYFAQLMKGDEELMDQWANSVNRSALLVKAALRELKVEGQQAFESLAQGMGAGIANAIVYSTSIGAAMQAALASTLESVAAQAMVQAIYAAGWGFLDLAEGNVVGAEAAFQAAAIFGSVGVAAAVTGRAIAPAQAGAGGASGASAAGGGSAGSASASGGAVAAQQQTPSVHIYIGGPVVGADGISQLTDIINQAVYGNDVTLYASHGPTGKPL